jgi:hypothetical protein
MHLGQLMAAMPLPAMLTIECVKLHQLSDLAAAATSLTDLTLKNCKAITFEQVCRMRHLHISSTRNLPEEDAELVCCLSTEESAALRVPSSRLPGLASVVYTLVDDDREEEYRCDSGWKSIHALSGSSSRSQSEGERGRSQSASTIRSRGSTINRRRLGISSLAIRFICAWCGCAVEFQCGQ